MRSFLLVSEAREVLDVLRGELYPGSKVEHTKSKDEALSRLKKGRYDIVLIDVEILGKAMPANGYKAVLQQFRQAYSAVEVIVISSREMVREAVKAVKAGAADYLTYPIEFDQVKHVIESIDATMLLQSELDYLRDQFWQPSSLAIIQTKSPVMQTVFAKIRSVAPTKSTVLLTGETGTGKGVLASLIHQHSNRRDAKFVSVHCGAIPDTLLESELFGHEKGAFTGADRRKLGKFEVSKQGTVFLDEIGTITPAAQIKLLQVLQDGTYQRVGGEETLHADVRVIVASNMDLKEMCDNGQFRKDLYFRLNVFPVEIPPLRERKEDIPHIVEVIIGRLNRFHLKEIRDIHPDVMEAFLNYPWPGNIRELENLIERAYIIESSAILMPESFPLELFAVESLSAGMESDSSYTLAEVRRRTLEEIEKRYLKELLASKKGKIRESAEVAGITTRQLHKLLTKYGIKKEDFKSRTGHQ
ncbi:MAG: sigma-54-dependent Fis family transcriptional regulator [Deltaproteobacteria bacterium]|nr:MAG: sigma-54-dependent Fis family transcriptional regulator [Deltaproteobacteria bacterium]